MTKLIPDEELVKIPVKDNSEKLIYIKDMCPRMIIRLGAYIKKDGKKSCKDACLVRETVAQKLNLAQTFLPKGYRLMLRCGYRSLSLQKKRYEWMLNQLKKTHPDWSMEKLNMETSKCVAPLNIIPPHSTGGAVDLSLIGPNGRQLYMGTQLGRFTEKTYTGSNNISPQAKKNRKLLISVMTKTGFINYPTEWWHWSYGDQYWAAALKKKYSIYGGI
jgi:D-alanyl-D-alanine dipeptidase